MKFLILIFVFGFLTIFAYAQDEAVNMADPNMSLYKDDYTAASVVDSTGAYEGTVTKNEGVKLPKNCPACNLQGSINLVDENGTTVKTGDGSAVQTGTATGNGTR